MKIQILFVWFWVFVVWGFFVKANGSLLIMDFLFQPSQITGLHGSSFSKHLVSTSRDPLWPPKCRLSCVATRHCISTTFVPIQICEPGPLRNGQKETLRRYYYLICPKWQLLYLVFMRIFSLWTTKSTSIPIARLERAPGKHPGDFLISIDQATLYSSVWVQLV